MQDSRPQEPNQQYQGLFDSTRVQGKQVDTLKAPPDGQFYGSLSKADFEEDTQR